MNKSLLQEYIEALTTGGDVFTPDEMIKFAPIRKAIESVGRNSVAALNSLLIEVDERLKKSNPNKERDEAVGIIYRGFKLISNKWMFDDSESWIGAAEKIIDELEAKGWRKE